jgi:hypothetical protein
VTLDLQAPSFVILFSHQNMSSQSGDDASVGSAQTGAPEISISKAPDQSDTSGAGPDIDLHSHIGTPANDGNSSTAFDPHHMSRLLDRLERQKGKRQDSGLSRNEFEAGEGEERSTKNTAGSVASDAPTGFNPSTMPGSPYVAPQGESQGKEDDHHFFEQLGDGHGKPVNKHLRVDPQGRGRGKGPGA